MHFPKRNIIHALPLLFAAGAYAQDVQVIDLNSSSSGNSSNVSELSITSNNSSAGASQNAQLYMLLQQLQDEVRSLRGQLEAQTHKLNRLEAEQKDRYRDLDRRVSFLTRQPAASGNSQANSSATKLVQPSDGSSPAKVISKPATASSSNAGDQQAYKDAFALVRKRAYDDAIVSFDGFIKKYTDSPLLPNAYYWLGEIYLLQQKRPLARDAFLQVVTNYSEHRKAPDAAYKLGKLYSDLGDTASSRAYLDMVISKYPNSPAARLAQEFQRQ